MNILQRLVLALAWMGFHSLVNSTIEEHPPVLEGSNVTLTCSGTTQSRDRVYWKDTQRNSNISTCYFANRTCTNERSEKYKAKVRIEEGKFSSSLTIEKITSEAQNTILECSDPPQAWRLSKVFYGPDDMACTAVIMHFAVINVSCSTPKVHPGIVCQIFQIHNGKFSIVNPANIKYDYGFTGSKRYNPALCTAILPVHLPGTYQYLITAFAGVSNEDRPSSGLQQIRTNEVTVDSSVVNEQKTNNVCSDNKTTLILFWCTAYAIPAEPTFVWDISNVPKEAMRMKTISRSENFYRSVIEIRNVTLIKNIRSTCKVHYKEGNFSKILEDKITAKLLNVSPQQVYLTHKGVRITSMFDVKEEETTGTFVCESKGGEPAVTSLHVKCQASDRSKILIDSSADGEALSFTINYNKAANKHGFCECFTQHQCNNSSAKFTFSVASTRPSGVADTPSTYIIYYIIAGTIGAIFLIIILGTIMFLCNRWRDLYSYIYFYFSIAGTIGRRTLERDFVHQYEPITSFSRNSNQRPQWAQVFQEDSGTFTSDLASYERNIYPVGVYINTKCSSNGSHQNHGIGINAYSTGSSERTHLQCDFHQLGHLERGSLVSCNSVYSLQVLHEQASDSVALDESSSLNHYHAPPPVACRTSVSQNVRLPSGYASSCSSIEDGKSDTDNECPRNESPEISESEESVSVRSRLRLPPKPCFRRTSTNEDVYFAPISTPSNEITFATAGAIMDEVHFLYKLPSLQSTRRSLLSTSESPDESSPEYSDTIPDVIPRTNRNRAGRHHKLQFTPPVPGKSLVHHKLTVSSGGSNKSKCRKKHSSRIGDYHNLPIKPRVSRKTTLHCTRTDRFQRDLSRKFSNTSICGGGVYQNVQPAPPIPHRPPFLSLETSSLHNERMTKPRINPRKVMCSSADNIYLEPIPKLPPREPLAGSAATAWV